MNRIKGFFYKVSGAVAGVLIPAMAFAEPPSSFTLPELPMGQMYTLGGTILAGLAVMWVYRKLTKTTNRS